MFFRRKLQLDTRVVQQCEEEGQRRPAFLLWSRKQTIAYYTFSFLHAILASFLTLYAIESSRVWLVAVLVGSVIVGPIFVTKLLSRWSQRR